MPEAFDESGDVTTHRSHQTSTSKKKGSPAASTSSERESTIKIALSDTMIGILLNAF